jgi:phage recombination protein Bet
MPEMIFQSVGGRPAPRLPYGLDGERLEPDGATLFDLEQAAAHFGESPEYLSALWRAAFGNVIDNEDSAVVDAAVSDAPVEPAPDAARSSRFRLLHRTVYPHLDDDAFSLFVEICRERKLNPFAGQLCPQMEFKEDRQRLELTVITTAAAIRLIAQRTGLWLGESPAQFSGPDGEWKDLWPDGDPPFSARVSVRRKGVAEPVCVPIYYDDVVQRVQNKDGSWRLAKHWRERPRTMMAKCASVASHRAAFAEELANIYSFDEMPAGGKKPALAPEMKPQVSRDLWEQIGVTILDEDSPASPQQFELALIDLGFQNLERRKMLIQQLHERFPGLAEVNPLRFYAVSLEVVKANPRRFGAQ